MSTKAELLAEAKELGLEFTEGVTNAQIQDAIDQKKTGAQNGSAPEDEGAAGVTPAGEDLGEQETEEEKAAREASEKAADDAAEAARLKEEEEQKAAEEEQARLEKEAKAEKPSEGSEIAAAIREGLKDGKEDKRIKITTDKSVVSRFSVVRSKSTGEVLLRENETGVLSKVQLQSLEEKEASIQGQEVEDARAA